MIIPPALTPPLPPPTTQAQPNVVQQALAAPMQAASQTASATRTQMKSAAAPAGRNERTPESPDSDRSDERMSVEARAIRQKRRGGALDVTL